MKYLVGVVILLVVYQTRAEDYEEVDYDADASASVDSESNEIYNRSLSSKPKRDFKKDISVTKLSK